jgi:cell wall-associated NlpC family hydrolase
MRDPIGVLGRVGINVQRTGEDDLDAIRSAGFESIRVACLIDDSGPPNVRYDLRAYLAGARARGLRVLLVLDRDAFWWPDWSKDTERYVRHWLDFYVGLFDGLQVGNEPDATSPSSWTLDAAEFGRLVTSVRAIVGPDVFLVGGGLASGQPGYLDGFQALAQLDAIALHPYTKQARDMAGFVNGYRQLTGELPVLLSEWGCPADWGEDTQAEQTRDMVRWAIVNGMALDVFDWSDRGVAPFGLHRVDGSQRPALRAVAEGLLGLPVPQPPGPLPAPPPPAPAPDTGTDDLHAFARAAASRHDVDPDAFERQIQQESGFNPGAYNAQSGASGIAQIIPRFHPTVDPWNPTAALEYAATWLGEMLAEYGGSYKRALAAYNWGPGNVKDWDGHPESLPGETQHYLDVIIPGWRADAPTNPVGTLAGIVAAGMTRIGDPYVWGGKVPGAFDCSGFVGWCYQQQGIQFSIWYTDRMYDECGPSPDPQPGDPVFYRDYPGMDQPGTTWGHMGLWLSPSEVLDDRGGRGVGVHSHVGGGVMEVRRHPSIRAGSVILPNPCAPLISGVGYLSGDMANRLEVARAGLTIPALEPKDSKRTRAYWQKRAELLEGLIHRHYADDGAIKDELQRVGRELL